jgi:hypothetical protein
MILSLHKSKHNLLLTLKVLILGLTSTYIYIKISEHNTPELITFFEQLRFSNRVSILVLLSFLGLTLANWFLEILKWKTVMGYFQTITIKTAMKQSLYALTVSMATPNRLGDYGAKALFYDPKDRKKVLFLNFYSNSIQMMVTLIFGLFGLFYIVQRFGLTFSYTKLAAGICIVLILLFFGYRYKERQLIINGLSISRVIDKIVSFPRNLKFKTIAFSISRYLIFSFLFYRILIFFGASITFLDAIPLIFAMYLLVSIVPTFFLFDVIVRGGAAIWLFSFVGIQEVIVISTVLTMWVLNFVIPSIIGGYFMFSYTPKPK